MSEWWTYRPADLLLFSERVYWRLFELQNAALWPGQFLVLAFGAAILVCLFRPRSWSDRFIACVLGAAWIVVAWSFLWARYAPINWAAVYAIPLFTAEALLIAWWGGVRGRLSFRVDGSRRLPGLALFVYALALHPFVAVIAGRPLRQAEIVGLAPDPTAIATLALLSLTPMARATWLLFLVPAAWCAASWATLQTMGTGEAWIPLAAVAVALAQRALSPR